MVEAGMKGEILTVMQEKKLGMLLGGFLVHLFIE